MDVSDLILAFENFVEGVRNIDGLEKPLELVAQPVLDLGE
jgi:hypothetical protein